MNQRSETLPPYHQRISANGRADASSQRRIQRLNPFDKVLVCKSVSAIVDRLTFKAHLCLLIAEAKQANVRDIHSHFYPDRPHGLHIPASYLAVLGNFSG
jgi:hypothetical protein